MKIKKTVALIAALSMAMSTISATMLTVSAADTAKTAVTDSASKVDYSGAKSVAYNMTAPYEGIVSTLSFEFTDVAIAENAKTLSIGLGTMNFPDLKDIIGDNYSLSNRERANIDVLYDIQEVTVVIGSDKYIVSNDTSSEDFNRIFADDYSNLPSTDSLKTQWGRLDTAYLDAISLTNFRDALKRNDKDAGYYAPVKISVEVKIAAKAIGSYANKNVIGDYRDAMMAYAEKNMATVDQQNGLIKNGKTASTEVETTFVKTMNKAILEQPTIYKERAIIKAYNEADISGMTVSVPSSITDSEKNKYAIDEFRKLFDATFGVGGSKAFDGYKTPNFSGDCVGQRTGTEVTTPTVTEKKISVVKAIAPVSSIVSVGDNSSIKVTSDGTNSKGSASKNEKGGVTYLTVSLDSSYDGEPEGGTDTSKRNYHLTIPVSGLTTDWEFESGYVYDDTKHKDWNIALNTLKLWLPVETKSTQIVLKKGTEKLYLVVDTIAHGESAPTTKIPTVSENIISSYDTIFAGITDFAPLCNELKAVGITEDGEYTFKCTSTSTSGGKKVCEWGNPKTGMAISSTAAANLLSKLSTSSTQEGDTVILKVEGLGTTVAVGPNILYGLRMDDFLAAQGWKEVELSEKESKIVDDNGKTVTYNTYKEGTKAYTGSTYAKMLNDIKVLENNVTSLQAILAAGVKAPTDGDEWYNSMALIKEKTSSGTTSLPRPETVQSREWYYLAGAYDYRNSQYYLAEIVDTIGDAKGAIVSFHIVPTSFKRNEGVAPTISSYDAARYLTSGAQGSTLLRVNSVSTNSFMNLITYDSATSTLSFDWDAVTNAKFSDNILYVRTLDLLATATFDIDEVQITIPNQDQFVVDDDDELPDTDEDNESKEIEAGENEDNDNVLVEEDDNNNTDDTSNIDLGNDDKVEDAVGSVTDTNPPPADVVDVTPPPTTVPPVDNTPTTGDAIPVAGLTVTGLAGIAAAVLTVFKKKQ